MRAQDELRAVIRQMQAGDSTAAAKLRRLLDAGELDAAGQAAAHVWLAEASDDAGFKLQRLQNALACTPDNAQIQQAVQALLAEKPPRPNLPSAPSLPDIPRVVGINGGANGVASAVFVMQSGMLATTSYALGGAQRLTVSLGDGRTVAGKLLRRFPGIDLALAALPLRLDGRLPIAPPAALTVGQELVALGFDGARLQTKLTALEGVGAGHWLATNLPVAKLPDAGGNPLYDDRGQLAGLMTRNTAGGGMALALKISAILTLAEQAQRDKQMQPGARCCPACGGLARSPIYGGHSCESCGGDLPVDETLAAPQTDILQQLYGEAASRACAHCGARVGFQGGRCLRCGQRSER
ncbi:MAG: S1C family serine protease [Chloroflexi bacterium]|nr:S1C family serine protease [Chloroflexota bacterium]MCY4248131.1 S1C family serine protease [Chloroflexota bacterium]